MTKPDIDQDIINAEAANAPDDKHELTDEEVAAFVLAQCGAVIIRAMEFVTKHKKQQEKHLDD